MDRLICRLTGGTLAVMLFSGFAGCRSMRPEVPPSRPYTSDGKQVPPIEFSSAPNPASAMNGFNLPNPSGSPGSAKYGIPSPGASNLYGAPTNNAYGPPVTSPTLGVGSGPSGYMPSASNPTTSIPQSGMGDSSPKVPTTNPFSN